MYSASGTRHLLPSRWIILASILCLFWVSMPSGAMPIRGFVLDATSGEPLPATSVLIPQQNRGDATNLDGYFSIPGFLPGKYTLQVSHLGYHTAEVEIRLSDEIMDPLRIELMPASIALEEVVVTVDQGDNTRKSTRVSTIPVDGATVRTLPSLGAEMDLMRALQAIPGVKASSELSSALYVRGGSSDMTLIQMDQSAVYNPSHLFGLFSTFNADAVKHLELIKGGFPAEYGGRAGSVLDVVTKEGNRKKCEGLASASVISARLAIEGPLPNENGSYAVSGRRTYLEPIISILKQSPDFADLPDYYFYDANAKINWDFSPSTTLTIGGYTGFDNLNANFGPADSKLIVDTYWGNKTLSSRLRHVLSGSMFLTVSGTYSLYQSGNGVMNEGAQMGRFRSLFREASLRSDLECNPGKGHHIKSGLQYNHYRTAFEQRNDEVYYIDVDSTAWNGSWYLQDDWRFHPQFETNTGIRLYYHDAGEYVRLDPRFALVYHYNEQTRFKFATGRYTQWINVITFGEGVNFLDIWTPNDGSLDPTYLYHYVLGFEFDPGEAYEFTVEGYYNDMHNIVTYNTTIDAGQSASDAYIQGEGYAYGFEWMLQRKFGRWTGWLGYSLSWVKYRFPGTYYNSGEWFYPKWDRRHDLVAIFNYKISKHWHVSTQFRYNTGQGYTRALGLYTKRWPGIDPEYSARGSRWIHKGLENNYRLPADHRLDINLTYDHTLFGLDAKAVLSVYNAYSRRSHWARFYDTDKNPVEVRDIRLLPILPLLGYEVRW